MEINELLNEVLSAERRAAEIASEAKSNAREIVMKAESDAKQYIAKAKEDVKAANNAARAAADGEAARLTEKLIEGSSESVAPDTAEAVRTLTEKYKAKYGCR